MVQLDEPAGSELVPRTVLKLVGLVPKSRNDVPPRPLVKRFALEKTPNAVGEEPSNPVGDATVDGESYSTEAGDAEPNTNNPAVVCRSGLAFPSNIWTKDPRVAFVWVVD